MPRKRKISSNEELKRKEEERDQQKQLKARLLKIRLAGVGLPTGFGQTRREQVQNPGNTPQGRSNRRHETGNQTQSRLEQEKEFLTKGKKIRPPDPDFMINDSLKKKLAKIKSAGRFDKDKPNQYGDTPEQARARQLIDIVQKNRKLQKHMNSPEGRKANHDFVFNDKKINPSSALRKERMKEAKIAHEHGHTILMKGHTRGVYRGASLESQQGHYAKYWLLNAKQTNGNGWGIAAHSAKANMAKFIGRPLVVTSSKWHGASDYGEKYDHPYVPTNDLNKIFEHQEKYRVGTIVDIGESGGDYHAMIEMLPKFANMTLPPFCSPAIYQLDAQEAEGQISKWEALHLAALDENPAYGARIALLKGTCVGTNHECRVQFKSAKLKETSIACPIQVNAIREKLAAIDDDALKKKLEDAGKEVADTARKKHNSQPLLKEVPFGGQNSRDRVEDFERMSVENNAGIAGKKIRPKTPTQEDRIRIIKAKLAAKLKGDKLKTQKSLDEGFFKSFKSRPNELNSDPEFVDIHKRMSETTFKNDRKKYLEGLKKNQKVAVKLISDEQVRALRERLGPNDNFPDDGMKRSPADSRRNFNIQTRAIAREKLDSLTSLTRRGNPKTPLIDKVPFGKERRPKKNIIGQSLQDEDRQDEFLALDFTNELNPISSPPKPRQQDRTRIIQAKLNQKIAGDDFDDFTIGNVVGKQLKERLPGFRPMVLPDDMKSAKSRFAKMKQKLAFEFSKEHEDDANRRKPKGIDINTRNKESMPFNRDNPDTPLIKEVPFGKENRTKKKQDIDTMVQGIVGLGTGTATNRVNIPPPKQADRRRIIHAKLDQINQKIAGDDFDDFTPVGQSTPKQKKRINKSRNIRGRNNEITRQVRKIKYNRRTNNGENMDNFDTPKPNEKEKMVETKARIKKNLPTDRLYSTPEFGALDGDFSRPAQLQRKLAKLKQKVARTRLTPLRRNINLTDTDLSESSSIDARMLGIQSVNPKTPLIKEVPFGKQDNFNLERSNKARNIFSKAVKEQKAIRPSKPTQRERKKIILAKLKLKLASLGEQNMTYQNSKKIKIHKKKHPEVRKAQSSVEDILRKSGRSVDGSHHQSTFLSSTGDFIGGGDIHDIQIRNILDPTGGYGETVTNDFLNKHGLARVQTFPINRAGEKRISFGINSKLNRTQLKSIKDSEIGGRTIGFAVGPSGKEITGTGFKDLTKALQRHKLV